jgi:hypothetical protein
MKFGNMDEIDNTEIINDRGKHDHVMTLVKHINNTNIINHIASWMEFTKQRMLPIWMKFNTMDPDNFYL